MTNQLFIQPNQHLQHLLSQLIEEKRQLSNTIEKIKSMLDLHGIDTQALQGATALPQETTAPAKKLAIPEVNGYELIEANKIMRLEAKGSYTLVHKADGTKLMASRSLKSFEPLLDQRLFLRVHQSHMVNIQFIIKYYRGKTGSLVMKDQSIVPVSGRRKVVVLERLGIKG